VAQTKKLGMTACAITDHGNLYGAIEFYNECKKGGIKPIIGYEAYLAPGPRTDRDSKGELGFSTHLTLLAKNATGFKNLIKMSSVAYLEGFYRNPRIDRELLEAHSEGIICLSGCLAGEFNQYIIKNKHAEAEKTAKWFRKIFGENFYIEIQNNGIALQDECTPVAADIAQKLGVPLVATADAHYLCSEDARAHDVLFCINTRQMHDPRKKKYPEERMPNPYYVRSPADMYKLFPGFEAAVARSQEIADGIDIRLDFNKRHFPVFQTPAGLTPEDYLRQLCLKGVTERYGENPSDAVTARLEHELAIICNMGFASYFLVVWDFVRFARETGIPSTARGSGCGAIVSYVLFLSHVCPLEYDLLFERFLDPNRSEAPDIDIDFCQDRRYEVIEYVRKKYGAANVAQIGTFGTMAAKAALKDVGRALNIPLARVDQVTKLIPSRLHITLEESVKEEPALRRLAEEDPDIKRLIELAQKLEGLARNVSTHAAGVVIADRPLDEMVPLQKIPNKDKEKEVVSTQWSMGDVEKAGLLKMDFLGLRNLSSLGAAAKLIAETKPGALFELNDLPLDDPKTYELLQRGETKGVFQFESAGIRDLLIKMKPDRFADIIATSALYRPGPLNGGMVDEYVNVKNKRKQAEYPHPVLKEILEETYGVMVYQEQVMRILNRLGGIELSQAYGCIKAISKKKTEIISQGRAQFLEGAVSRGLEKDRAAKIFEMIEVFGGYGFNKSHSTAYALVTFQTAWLKTHHPTEFMAAILSSEMDGAERDKFFYEHIEDCKRMGIEVLAPDVSRSAVDFRPEGEGKLRFGLGGIKGVGTKAVEAILKARSEGGPFGSLDDFFERVPTQVVGQGCVETLIKAGAFDSLGARRSQLLAVLPRAVLAGQSRQDDRKRGQRGFFDDDDSSPEAASLSLPDVPEMPDAEKLAEEKKALGFYMSSHPLARHATLLQAFRTHQASDLAGLADKGEVTLGGMIAGLTIRNVQKSRSGLTRMAKLSFEDLSGSTPAMLWPEEFAKNEECLKDDAIVFVKGTISRMRDPAEVIINRVIPIDRAAAELARGVVVRLQKGVVGRDEFERLKRSITQRQGGLDVYLELMGLEGTRRVIYKAGQGLKVRHDDRMIADFENAVGSGNVRLLGQGGSTTRVEPTSTATSTYGDAPAVEDDDE
ncbi:MAG: DNA-directed polymerase PolC, partial [Frankiales bacterium]|nr:DNA-directed polymerase PolC [Frankiales bacterium]